MKSLTLRLVVPLTIISFSVFTKWWYILPVEAPDSMMTGFPFPYTCTGWHTSMSLQFFMIELIADVLFYFTVWFVLIFCIDLFLFRIRLHKGIVTILVSAATILFSCLIFIASMPEHVFKFKKDFDFEVLDTGYTFFWKGAVRPDNFDFDAYEHERRKNVKK